MIRTLPLILLALLMLGSACYAQPLDRRISPPEIPTHRLPDDALIQSAATIGDVTLAAWGTTFRTSDDSLANRVVARVITGSTPSPVEHDLLGPEARPYGFLQVIPARNVFVVLWNDRRSDAPGIYTRRIGLDGLPASAALRLDAGRIVPDSTGVAMVLGSRALGQLVILPIARQGGGLFAWRITDAGLSQGAPRRLGDWLQQALRFSGLPGHTLLRIAAGRPALVDNAGRLNGYPIRRDLLDAPFHLAADSSLIRLAGDTVQFYRSLFDSIPLRAVRVRALDSATANTKLVGVDSAGAPHVFFATVRYIPEYLIVTGYDVRIDWSDSIAAPVQVFLKQSRDGRNNVDYNNYSTSRLISTAWGMGCDNTGLVSLTFEWTEYVHGHQQPSQTGTGYISLDATGRYVYSDAGYIGSCIVRDTNRLKRLNDTSRSAVRIRFGRDIIEMSSESALRVVDLPEHSPVACARGDALLGAWMAQGVNDTVVLGRWYPERREPASLLDAVVMSSRPPFTPDQSHLGLSYYRGDIFTGMNGTVGFVTNHLQIESRRVWPAHSYYSTSIVSAGSRLYFPDTNGWRPIMATSDGPHDTFMNGRIPMHQMNVRGYDPNRSEYLVALKLTDTYTPEIIYQVIPLAISDTGTAPAWALDTLGGAMANGALIPLDYMQALHVSNDTMAIRLTAGKKADTFMLPPTPNGAAYMRLLGPRFLRWYWGDSLRTVFRLDLFDLEGNLLAAGRTTIDPASKQASVVQSRFDSSIAVVHADSTGIRATLFDDMLVTVRSNALISDTRTSHGTPSATFIHDTLCVLWTDRRNGGYDIYGGMLAGARKSGVRERMKRGITSARIVPTPARDRAMLQLELGAGGELVLDLVDMSGQLLRTERLDLREGLIDHELALDGVPPGLYLLRYRIGDDAGWLPLPVVR